jgi:putative hydrolase of the HAD superfamily
LNPLRDLVISSEVGWRKPAPAFFDAIIRAVDVPASQILFVGDDLGNDYEGAETASMRAVLLDPRRFGSPEDGVERIHWLGQVLAHFR